MKSRDGRELHNDEKWELLKIYWPDIQQDFLLDGQPPASVICQAYGFFQYRRSAHTYSVIMDAFEQWLKLRGLQ
jgi:hypothetical protein